MEKQRICCPDAPDLTQKPTKYVVYHTYTGAMSFNPSSESSFITPQYLSRSISPPYFDAIIRTETFQSTSNSKRKRTRTQCVCTQCPSWSNTHRGNTIAHVLRHYAWPESSQLLHTPRTPVTMAQATTSVSRMTTDQNVIRNVFDR